METGALKQVEQGPFSSTQLLGAGGVSNREKIRDVLGMAQSPVAQARTAGHRNDESKGPEVESIGPVGERDQGQRRGGKARARCDHLCPGRQSGG